MSLSPPLMTGSPDDVDDLDLYNATLLGLLNKHTPEKVVPHHPSSPWISEAVIKAKQARRHAEKRKTGLVVDIEIYKQARNNATSH